VGAYVQGSNPRVDRALRSVHLVNALFRQGPQEKYTLESTLDGLRKALDGTAVAPPAVTGARRG
jgi:flagellar biosynthesis/type III secretory pathway ATPase